MSQMPWVTFCISTYQRPVLLKKQLSCLLNQSFPHFEVVVSDNDPAGSAKEITATFQNPKIKYFHNGENLGMMRSFNKSIDRAVTDYIVTITDDDPVVEDFLSDMYKLYQQYPDYSVYGGFQRTHSQQGELEIIEKDRFIVEILDPDKTTEILWSSCVIKKQAALEIGKIPDFESPHLADHALIAMVGSRQGGIVVNKMYSTLTQHDKNFSKSNFHYYTTACKGFYDAMTLFCEKQSGFQEKRKIIIKHIGVWFITNIFNLKRYHTVQKNREVVHQVESCARQIMAFPFMHTFKPKFYAKNVVFNIKKMLHLLS